mmetsp:Transcript_33687/g.32158  ORF Transcript_33687/g.32158 Transcript_33687/m.32158 type:complete len:153 (-) Transcript_33687:459-917(-)
MNRLSSCGMRRFFSSIPSTAPPTRLPLRDDVKLLNFRVPFPEEVLKPFSLATANQKEIIDHKKSLAVNKYQKRDGDTGSASVQIAVMTEDIKNLARHFTIHKKDKASGRGFQMLLSRRRKMMKYLQGKDFEEYRSVVISLGLEKEATRLQRD